MNNENEYEDLNGLSNDKNNFSSPQSYNRSNINFNVALSNPNLSMNDSMSLNIKDNSSNNMVDQVNNLSNNISNNLNEYNNYNANNVSSVNSVNNNVNQTMDVNNIASVNGVNNNVNQTMNVNNYNVNNYNDSVIEGTSNNNLYNINSTVSTINDNFNNQVITAQNNLEKEYVPVYNIDAVPEANNYLYNNQKEDLNSSNLFNDNNSGKRSKTINITKKQSSRNYSDLKFFVLITLIVFIVIMFFPNISKFFSDLINNR